MPEKIAKQPKRQLTVEQQFTVARDRRSDINQHIKTLYRLASRCDVVVEFGVRQVVSSWAFMMARPDKFTSVDLESNRKVELAQDTYRAEGGTWHFIEGDTLKVPPMPSDLLFIDTRHTYRQLSEELHRHGTLARKYIVLHDTVTFGLRDEGADYDPAEGEVAGLLPAIDEFIADNRLWHISEVYEMNNGLMVLKHS